MAKKAPDPDDLYRFLGFQISPGKIKEFWKSEAEKKQYLKGVEARGGVLSVLERETGLTNINLMTTADKVTSIIGALFLIVGFFLPVYSISTSETVISGSAISYFMNIPFIGGYASYSGIMMILAAIVFGAFLLSCPVAGVLNIMGILNKSKDDEYLETVKKFTRFNLVPIILSALFFVILVIGAPHPFGSLGMESLGIALNVSAYFTMTGMGFWFMIVGMVFGFAQARGL